MAGISGRVSTLKDIDQKIKSALYYRRVYIVNYHNRPHNFGVWLHDTRGNSFVDKDIDPIKLVAAIVECPRNCLHEVTTAGFTQCHMKVSSLLQLGLAKNWTPKPKEKLFSSKVNKNVICFSLIIMTIILPLYKSVKIGH